MLKGSGLDALTREAAALYGPEARIVRAERVLERGLAGLLGRRHVEATVLVPEPGLAAPVVPHSLAGRAGIAALLDDADRAEDALHTSEVSTQGERFDVLLERLRGEFDAPPEPHVPSVLDGVGDFVLVAGFGGAVLAVVRSMGAHDPGRWARATAGDLVADWPHLETPLDALSARADAVERDVPLLVAFTVGPLDALDASLAAAAALRADQVWLVVDARHKPEETAEWVEASSSCFRAAGLAVNALAVVGAAETRSPHTVNALGLPVGWVDGSPAPRTVL
ncbi:hypothetical protein [Sinomonas sp.]|uniref:hypothetical protein n=1 Tax=Sinomonas sp. TaxID=1914986 RepID=UPI003F7F1545